MLSEALHPYRYPWPREPLEGELWESLPPQGEVELVARSLPETREALERDSRWPGFFSAPLVLVTTNQGGLEKVVGASIVNRFPYVIALSFCRERLSDRHHPRTRFSELLEAGGAVAVQHLLPGAATDAALKAIHSIPDAETARRIEATGLVTERAVTNEAPVFRDSYMVYEARLARPARDLDGHAIYPQPWVDVGSHRVYLLEINAIQLRDDIARGSSQIHWQGMADWSPRDPLQGPVPEGDPQLPLDRYTKGYTPHYAFPAPSTVAFELDEVRGTRAVKVLAPDAADQIEVDDDRARWPCFFPSSCGLITTWAADGSPNLMPCGSTTILSRHPFVVAICVSSSTVNVRYARRASLDLIRESGWFGCGVPFVHDTVITAVRYAGNISFAADPHKVTNAGLVFRPGERVPILPALPLTFECKVVGEHRLGSHVMILGEVRRILARADLTPDNPLVWCPWPDVVTE